MTGSPDPTKIELVRELAKAEAWAVLPTARVDGTVQASIVSACVMDHPLSAQPVVAFLCRGGTVKIRNMRRSPQVTITFRSGSRWVTVEGQLTLVGPEDSTDGFQTGQVPELLRGIQTALRGGHDDWAAFDKQMVDQQRAAAYISLDRVYTNPGR